MDERKDYGLGEILKDIWSVGSNIAAILDSMDSIQVSYRFNI